MINHVNNWEKANKEHNNESITAELERYKERVKTFEQRLNIDLSSREKMIDSQMDDMIREKLALKEQIDSLEQNLSKQIKEKESLFKTFTVFKNESKEKENKYLENEIDLEKKIKELDNIVYKVGQSAQIVHMLTKPQAFYDNTHKQALGEVPSELFKVSLVNASLKKLKFHLAWFDSVVKKRTTPDARTEDLRHVLGSTWATKMPNTRSGASMTREEFEELVARRVAEELEAREAARTLEPLNENGDELEGENGGNGNGNGGNGNGNGGNGNGNGGNGNGNGNRNGNHGQCFGPGGNFKRTIGVEAAYTMNWVELMKLMTEVYCPRNEIQKMETELWNLTVKGNDLTAYTQRFQELILLCTRMVPDEEDRVERKSRGYAARSAGLKRRMESNLGITWTATVHSEANTSGRMWPEPRRLLGTMKEKGICWATFPTANKCVGLHHEGLCTLRCGNCKKAGHQTRDCRAVIAPNTQRAPVGNQQDQKQEWKQDWKLTGGNDQLTARAYAIVGGRTDPDSNVVTTVNGAFLMFTPTPLEKYAVRTCDGRIQKQLLFLEKKAGSFRMCIRLRELETSYCEEPLPLGIRMIVFVNCKDQESYSSDRSEILFFHINSEVREEDHFKRQQNFLLGTLANGHYRSQMEMGEKNNGLCDKLAEDSSWARQIWGSCLKDGKYRFRSSSDRDGKFTHILEVSTREALVTIPALRLLRLRRCMGASVDHPSAGLKDVGQAFEAASYSELSKVRLKLQEEGPEFNTRGIYEREGQMQKKYRHLFTNSAPAAEVAS
ncbi:putative reverse transcriptase domain-containing protein [Tanacetum coccineum]